MNETEKLIKENKKMALNTHYFQKNEIIPEYMEITHLISHQNTVLKIRQNNIKEAVHLFEKDK